MNALIGTRAHVGPSRGMFLCVFKPTLRASNWYLPGITYMGIYRVPVTHLSVTLMCAVLYLAFMLVKC